MNPVLSAECWVLSPGIPVDVGRVGLSTQHSALGTQHPAL